MTITSIEELVALPEGEQVRVASSSGGSVTWRKGTDDILIRPDMDVPVKASNFVGLIAAGRISRPGLEPGDVYVSGRNYYVVVRVDDGRVNLTSFRDESWRGLTQYDMTTVQGLTRVTGEDVPAWVPYVREISLALLEGRERHAQTTTELDRLRRAPVVRELTDEMVAVLHEVAADDNYRLDEALADWGIPRMVDHISDVRVHGTSNVYPDADQVGDMLDGGSADIEIVDVPTLRVAWAMDLSVTRSGAGCTCGEVTRDDVYSRLPERVRDDEWGFEAECA